MLPPKGHFILHSAKLPAVTAGPYNLLSRHTATPFTVADEATHVTVSSPRYVMPVEQILSTFPPANAEGAFSDRLPQIVLKRRTLPWERNPAGAVEPSTTPWLALVVLAENEGATLSTPTPVTSCVTSGVTLPVPADRDVEQGLYLEVTETVKNKVFPCAADLPLLCHVRQVDVTDTELAGGDDDGWLAVVLANRLPVYDTANDKPVRYLACLVNLEGQLGILPPPLPTDDDGFHFELAQDWVVLNQLKPGPDPVILGNVDLEGLTFPMPELRSPAGPADAAHARAPGAAFGARVASQAQAPTTLDGTAAITSARVDAQWATTASVKAASVAAAAADPDATRLVRDVMGNGFRFPISLVAQEPTFRFPVLAHWSFTTAGADTFESLMLALDVGLLGTVDEPDPAAAPAPAEPPEVVQTGHISLGHRTRRGDRLKAWYRGPLVPFPTERDAPVPGPGGGTRLPVAHAADQLKRVVPGGREDLGLAAAFEIGRLLGLSQLSVVSALTRFRAAQFGAGRGRTVVGGIVDVDVPTLDSLDLHDLGRFVAVAVLTDLAADPITKLGPRRPLVDPGRELDVDGALDEIIAGGLGLDLDVVRKHASAVGIVAALTQTSVPLAYGPGAAELDDNATAALRATLDSEVGRLVEIAVPRRQAPIRRDRQQAADGPRDALDDLLDTLGEEDDS